MITQACDAGARGQCDRGAAAPARATSGPPVCGQPGGLHTPGATALTEVASAPGMLLVVHAQA